MSVKSQLIYIGVNKSRAGPISKISAHLWEFAGICQSLLLFLCDQPERCFSEMYTLWLALLCELWLQVPVLSKWETSQNCREATMKAPPVLEDLEAAKSLYQWAPAFGQASCGIYIVAGSPG